MSKAFAKALGVTEYQAKEALIKFQSELLATRAPDPNFAEVEAAPGALVSVDFDGKQIEAVEADGRLWVVIKRACENIGLNTDAQRAKLLEQKEKFNYLDIKAVAADGKLRPMGCIPLERLNGWLFSINPEKVAEAIRPALVLYQEECFIALHHYWTKGEAKQEEVRQEPGSNEALEKFKREMRGQLTDAAQGVAAAYVKADMADVKAEEAKRIALDSRKESLGSADYNERRFKAIEEKLAERPAAASAAPKSRMTMRAYIGRHVPGGFLKGWRHDVFWKVVAEETGRNDCYGLLIDELILARALEAVRAAGGLK